MIEAAAVPQLEQASEDSDQSWPAERQILGKRRNAKKSAGPRSRAGKTRPAGNAHRHGLAAAEATPHDIYALARLIVGASAGFLLREHARAIAQAVIDLKWDGAGPTHLRQRCPGAPPIV
ncbi:hypothetical protein [Bradyrhizobium ganzhouense]|uniref:hypothetical protein n=1 Tax=Bradyrhizobium ganzhouense TaxID=1179767 RepID=UPI003CF89CA8